MSQQELFEGLARVEPTNELGLARHQRAQTKEDLLDQIRVLEQQTQARIDLLTAQVQTIEAQENEEQAQEDRETAKVKKIHRIFLMGLVFQKLINRGEITANEDLDRLLDGGYLTRQEAIDFFDFPIAQKTVAFLAPAVEPKVETEVIESEEDAIERTRQNRKQNLMGCVFWRLINDKRIKTDNCVDEFGLTFQRLVESGSISTAFRDEMLDEYLKKDDFRRLFGLPVRSTDYYCIDRVAVSSLQVDNYHPSTVRGFINDLHIPTGQLEGRTYIGQAGKHRLFRFLKLRKEGMSKCDALKIARY